MGRLAGALDMSTLHVPVLPETGGSVVGTGPGQLGSWSTTLPRYRSGAGGLFGRVGTGLGQPENKPQQAL